MDHEYLPRETLDNVLRYWWLIIVFMLAGAIVGRIGHLFLPPVYETHAKMGISIDYSRTGLLSDIEEDQAFGTVADVFSTEAVLNKVVEIAKSENILVDTESLKKIVIHERTDNTWLFRARHKDPVIAAQLANIWIEESYKALDDAYAHTLLAESYQRYMDSLTSCVENIVAMQPTNSYCNMNNLEHIQAELVKTSALVKQEREESLGIIPGISFRIVSMAEVPGKPARHRLSTLMLSGSMIGLITGLWIVSSNIPKSLRRAKQDA